MKRKKKRQGEFVFPNREPIARTVDPRTSVVSGEQLTDSGDRARQKNQILGVVQSHPGLTSRELAQASGIANEILHKRLPDLKRDGFVATGDARRCQVTGRQAMTWIAIKSGKVGAQNAENSNP